MPYLMGGFPDLATSAAVIDAYADTGADLIELGVPYSDPLADGPLIHAAGTKALQAGASSTACWSSASGSPTRLPVLPMVYANVVLTLGSGAVRRRARGSGRRRGDRARPATQRGSVGCRRAARAETGTDRIRIADDVARTPRADPADAVGFTYVVSLAGVTGERKELPPELGAMVEAVKAASDAPAAVGFGIGTPEQAAQVGEVADGVIIGTRLVRAVRRCSGRSRRGRRGLRVHGGHPARPVDFAPMQLLAFTELPYSHS